MIFSADDESEEEGELVSTTSLSRQSHCNKGPTISVGAKVSEELAITERSIAMEEQWLWRKQRGGKLMIHLNQKSLQHH